MAYRRKRVDSWWLVERALIDRLVECGFVEKTDDMVCSRATMAGDDIRRSCRACESEFAGCAGEKEGSRRRLQQEQEAVQAS